METKPDRLPYIDSIKGFAILLVVFAHVAEKYYKFDIYPAYTAAFRVIYDIIYSFHMPLFMIISGFLFHRSYFTMDSASKRDRLKSHWLDMAIAYLWASVLTGISKIIFPGDVLHPITSVDIFLVWMKPIGHLWYLHLLLILYLINTQICRLKNRNRFFHIVFYITLLVAVLSGFLSDEVPILLRRVLYYEFFFCAGMILDYEPNHWLSGRTPRMLLSASSIALLYYIMMSGIVPPAWINLIIALGLSLLVIESIKSIPALSENRLLQKTGTYSFEIYLLHQFPVTIFQKILPQLFFISAIPSLLLNFIASTLIIVGVVFLLKKISLYQLLFRPYSCYKSNSTNLWLNSH